MAHCSAQAWQRRSVQPAMDVTDSNTLKTVGETVRICREEGFKVQKQLGRLSAGPRAAARVVVDMPVLVTLCR